MNAKTILRVALAVGTVLVPAPVDAAPFNDWSSRQELEVTAPGLVRVALSPETFDAAQATLADLRLVDPTGTEVPYRLERPQASSRMLRPADGWQVFLEAGRTRVEMDLRLRGRCTAVVLETPSPEFLKAASMEGTKDGITRTLFKDFPLFRQAGGATQLRLKLPEGDWQHLRITLDDARSKPIAITGIVILEEDSPAPPPAVFATVPGERVESDSQTRIAIDLGAARIPLAGLRFHTGEPLFIRRVDVLTRGWENGEIRERSLGSGTLFRVALEGEPTTANLDLVLSVQPPTRELVLVIENGDSPPLPIEAIEALWNPTELLFLARQSGLFQLLSGNSRAAGPRYDVSGLSSLSTSAAVARLRPGSLVANPEFHPSEPLPEIPVLAAALDVEGWSFRRALKLAAGSVQQLELTPHVLAHSHAGLGDLRLVADGRQVPFILERPGFNRAIHPEVSRADDPKRPRLSSWTIRLPQPRLPVVKLSCETQARLFQRDVRVFEEVVDGRGERHARSLGNATWIRRPESKVSRLNVMIVTAPVTETLRLEMDNGDNPGIDLEKFQAFVPVSRMLFKAPPGETVMLCYGNPQAASLTYDLDLVAPRLLAASKSEALLADADPVGAMVRGGAPKSLPVLFYGALALVVVVLALVIIRLLPKPATPA